MNDRGWGRAVWNESRRMWIFAAGLQCSTGLYFFLLLRIA